MLTDEAIFNGRSLEILTTLPLYIKVTAQLLLTVTTENICTAIKTHTSRLI